MSARLLSPSVGTPPGRVAVIGDVGGHHDALAAELGRLGVGRDGRLPDDLTVVQVGDLVHRGPDSAAVVALVDRYRREQPDRWVQLAGNHEAQYLREPAFVWPEQLDDGTAATLRDWWRDGWLRVAAAVEGSDGEQWLVTHAGLTRGFWREVLDAPVRAGTAADRLNALGAADDDRLFRAGRMLGGGPADLAAGPLWAEAAGELLAGWTASRVPFSQLHGHAVATGRHSRLDPWLAEATRVDRSRGHEETALAGGRIVGVDPGHGRRARRAWQAYVLGG
ncbi:hypothetical protein FHX74_000663 [Friedmanniella endophytica]|uniref:Calcineurin-like phosphoesterase domain-containing protein n=1 Tax=Microlunatus kandeliicorticis TaxID=1759536 RepID=A0A7W3IPX2_9ACTN|nr:metallophosphoesterase [Microlunatus kandeliicorticis]MBA8793069.1 hypothetical protein [Microlunatus kandeliicorticis]